MEYDLIICFVLQIKSYVYTVDKFLPMEYLDHLTIAS